MARRQKIPGKKHHGVKDPAKQKIAREAKIKNKVNAPPRGGDDDDGDQQMPRKLLEIMKAKEDAKRARLEAKKKAKQMKKQKQNAAADEDESPKELLDSSKFMAPEMNLKGMSKPLRPVPIFRQEPGESKRAFFNRMEATTKAVLERRKFEDKFDVEVTQNESGETEVKDRQRDEIEEHLHQIKAKKLKKKKGIVVKTKEEKRAIRRMKEKAKRMKKRKANRDLIDEDGEEVKEFAENRTIGGITEVVEAPPSLEAIQSKASKKRLKPKNARDKTKELLLSRKL